MNHHHEPYISFRVFSLPRFIDSINYYFCAFARVSLHSFMTMVLLTVERQSAGPVSLSVALALRNTVLVGFQSMH